MTQTPSAPGYEVHHCAILADPRSEEKRQLVQDVASQLETSLQAKGIEVDHFIGMNVNAIEPKPGTDLFLVLGGDGTMIHFAARLCHFDIPFYGLNFGNVGFMMNNPLLGLSTHAQKINLGNFMVWEFPVLGVEATDRDGKLHHGFGLNDIYLQRMTPQSCKVNIYLDGESLPINPILCDGLIVATPLGSTAYNYNVTGSMVAINAPVLTLTPIAAARSCKVSCMMLPISTEIRFDILEPTKRSVQVVSDGQSHGGLTRATIRAVDRKVRLCFDPEFSANLPMRFIAKACMG